MITKKHIRQYSDRLSSDGPTRQDGLSDHFWQQLHEYVVKHYKRLDKGARAYADEMFDQLDASVRQRIDSLPEGQERKLLSRKLSVVRGERSPLPVLYLDTPVIEDLIRYGLGQPPLNSTAENSKALYEEILDLVKDRKLVCPEDTFHREALQMGGRQAREGLNVIRRLSQGLSFKHSQTIEDFQIFRALRGFINANGHLNHRKFWKDAFQEQTVRAIMKKRSSIEFGSVLALCDKPGAEERPASLSTRLRIRYDETALKHEQQLQQRSTRHLRDLVRLGMKYQTMVADAQERHLNGFWAGQKVDLAIALWNHYGGKPEGLEGLIPFYESEHFRDVPAIRIKRDLWNALAVSHENRMQRVTGPQDVTVLSSVLPYTDLVILGPKMTDVAENKLGLGARFDTEIYGMDEPDRIMAALREVARAD